MNTPALRLAVVLLLLSAALTLLGVCVGSAGFEDLLGPLLQRQADAEQSALAAQIVWDIRLPRTLGAWTAGALLGLAGAVAQGLFRNPLADPYLLGSASGAALGVAIAWALGRVLDGLSLGETTARSLGMPVASIRMVLVGVLAIATGTAVAQTGLIAFVGLAAPHLVRSVVRTGYRWLIVLASLMGAVLLMAADVLARWLIAPQELPVGVVTAVLGGAYLLWLMRRNAVAQGAA